MVLQLQIGKKDLCLKWSKEGVWQELNAALVGKGRSQMGRQSCPGAAVIDSQTVKLSSCTKSWSYQ